MINVTCKTCGKNHKVSKSRETTYKTCSRECYSIYKKTLIPNNCVCTNCKKEFHLKPSQIKRYNRSMGIFCSMSCSTEFKKDYYKGSNNPNFRGSQYDSDGYRINHYPKVGRVKEHRYVTEKFIGRKIPSKFIIHHRDCNIYNNTPGNLSILSNSDHIWIHKQYGSATLYALETGKVTLNEVISWSNDKERATFILNANLCNQAQGIFDFNTLRKSFEDFKSGSYPQIEFEEVQELSDSERGEGSYGSTGK